MESFRKKGEALSRSAVWRLNGISPTRWLLLFLLLYGMVTAGVLCRVDFDPAALIRFGAPYAAQNPRLTPPGATVYTGNESHGGNGYDGQIFYYYARTLFLPGAWPRGFNNAYRAPRIGYPFLSALFSPLGSWGVVAGMFIVQIVLLLAGLYCFHLLLPPRRRFLTLFYLISPFTLQSYLLLVSDSVMISLQMIGFYFFLKSDEKNRGTFFNDERGVSPVGDDVPALKRGVALAIAFCAFSLAVLTKESALFFLFPLGLLALWRRDRVRIALLLSILLPMIFWQIYLRSVHGMVPAGILQIFLSPFAGIMELLLHTVRTVNSLIGSPSLAALFALAKLGARSLLLLLILGTLPLLPGRWKERSFPFRAAIIFVLLSVCIADYYYFWGVYENISRMFTPLVPLVLLLKAEEAKARSGFFLLVLTTLFLLVVLRLFLISPVFPSEKHRIYNGPDYSRHAPRPGDFGK